MAKAGPKTARGKAIAAQNATTHGVLSRAAVVAGLEQPEEWEAHRAGVLQSLAAVGQLEVAVAERIALLLWRLQRVARYEGEKIALGQEKVAEDVAAARRQFGVTSSDRSLWLEDAGGAVEYRQENLRVLQRF